MNRLRQFLRERGELVLLLSGAGSALPALLGIHGMAALAPGAIALATGRLLDTTLGLGGTGSMIGPLAVVAGVVLVGQCVEVAAEPLNLSAARRIDGKLRSELRRRVAEPPDISHLDGSAYSTDVSRVSELGGWRTRTPGTGAVGQVILAGRLTGAVLSAAVLAWYAPWLAVVLLTITLVRRAAARRQWVRLGVLWDSHAGDRRGMDYWADLLSGAPGGKEIRLFGLGAWLTDRHDSQTQGWLSEIWRERRGILWRQWWSLLLALAAGFSALYVPGVALSAEAISYGDLITMVLAAWGIFAAGVMGYEAFDIEYAVGAMRALGRIRDHADPDVVRGTRPAPERTPHIRFAETGFSYPEADHSVLDGLRLDIRPGEVLGVVGRNGAGKTTMIKLLAGLQRPTAGRVLIDGTDLADLDPDAWRQRVSAVFQDFLHYPLTVRENIAFGAPEAACDDEAVLRAADLADARELIERLPDGLDTLLTREHTGGLDLSGGQWQRIAIARALFAVAHGRRVLIFDEPTANLDVRAEAEFYDRVVSAVSGVTVVLISHRLSTVRRADRIVLLDGGRISESGSHADLMNRDGVYAGLYRLQAMRFADDVEAPAV